MRQMTGCLSSVVENTTFTDTKQTISDDLSMETQPEQSGERKHKTFFGFESNTRGPIRLAGCLADLHTHTHTQTHTHIYTLTHTPTHSNGQYIIVLQLWVNPHTAWTRERVEGAGAVLESACAEAVEPEKAAEHQRYISLC